MHTFNPSAKTESIRIRGQVQGVGFRPTVYRLAHEWGIRGHVINDNEGVLITASALDADLEQFIEAIQTERPALARIDSIEREAIDGAVPFTDFTIEHSQDGVIDTGMIADAASCPDCLAEINDPDNRRHAYAFTNCTHCGPRLSIVEGLPYDRSNTSMREFTLCESCQNEYRDPANRRFHAQPNACPDCGPVLQLSSADGTEIVCEDAISTLAEHIAAGQIAAIKGIGGFQLACNASNEAAIARLRERKHRPHKALALMANSIDAIRDYCLVSDDEARALNSAAAPIVILQKHPQGSGMSLPEAISPEQNSLGFMLPANPLHHLLMQQLDRVIVLTSGNVSEEPQCIDNDDALERLASIADVFLLHNRTIVNRIDDSVTYVQNNQQRVLRRARGFAPAPLSLPADLHCQRAILALGGELKNTFALARNAQVTLSQHIGNLENLQSYQDYLKQLQRYQDMYRFQADAIVIDQHPEYLSSKLGRQLAEEHSLPLLEVQHHHAHIASCLAENQRPLAAEPVIGVALDGLGYGENGELWGGEFLLADYCNYTRLGRLNPVPLPGATQAMLEPWRNTFANLAHLCDWDSVQQRYRELKIIRYLQHKPVDIMQGMLQNQIASPYSSSCGRLFDAVAGLLGVHADAISYEGQAAMTLESLLDASQLKNLTPYHFDITATDMLEIDTRALWFGLLDDLADHASSASISARFHLTLAHMILHMVLRIQSDTGLNTVALSGGVMQNRTLSVLTEKLLSEHQFTVLSHSSVPANDGGLSLGQAAIATARLLQENNESCAWEFQDK